MIRVVLPHHLRTLAQVHADVELEIRGPVTQRSVLDALEARYPMFVVPFATLHTPNSVGRSCGSSPAKKVSPQSRQHAPPYPDVVASGAGALSSS